MNREKTRYTVVGEPKKLRTRFKVGDKVTVAKEWEGPTEDGTVILMVRSRRTDWENMTDWWLKIRLVSGEMYWTHVSRRIQKK